jgi:predicted HAD superfamily phosphohydrolase YqeG
MLRKNKSINAKMNIKEFGIYLKEKNKKHIIFDFDETICTLLINWDNWIKEMEEIFSQCNVKLSSSELAYSRYAKAQNSCIMKKIIIPGMNYLRWRFRFWR